MTTISTKQSDIEKKWILIDATDVVVGRLASFIAKRLRGKHLASFTPHVDDGDNVVVINAEKIHFTGNKLTDKKYYKHTGYRGGIKMQTPEDILSTLTELTVKKIQEYFNFCGAPEKVIFHGGGAENKYLMHRIKETIKAEISTIDNLISSKYVESAAFAYLAFKERAVLFK